ncbi:hypothetical protein GQ42DRAFT_155593 [Ramicandelaber brevisporus]|nr:hypothetical protein GQ42DRAFT_155593 [Ramicandelaber brevisporus]
MVVAGLQNNDLVDALDHQGLAQVESLEAHLLAGVADDSRDCEAMAELSVMVLVSTAEQQVETVLVTDIVSSVAAVVATVTMTAAVDCGSNFESLSSKTTVVAAAADSEVDAEVDAAAGRYIEVLGVVGCTEVAVVEVGTQHQTSSLLYHAISVADEYEYDDDYDDLVHDVEAVASEVAIPVDAVDDHAVRLGTDDHSCSAQVAAAAVDAVDLLRKPWW